MKRILTLLLVLIPFSISAQAPDSSALAALDEKMGQYLSSIETATADQKKAECDYMLSACATQAVRNHVARQLYGHFVASKLMGDDAVAVHLYDNWFAPGKAEFSSEIDKLNAGIYATFNRSSLIGSVAPEIIMTSAAGESINVTKPSGLWKVLYFYDTSCSRCALETIQLSSLMASGKPYEVEVNAIYTGSDSAAWEKYREDKLSFTSRHFWDPSIDSDFQMKYGVLQTPKIFLIDPAGVITGRSLDTPSLEKLLDAYALEVDYDAPEVQTLLSGLFEEGIPAGEAIEVAKEVSDLAQKMGGGRQFRSLVGGMMFHLCSRRDASARKAAAFVVDSLVLKNSAMWTSPRDSAMVLDFAVLQHNLLHLADECSVLPSVKVHGELLTERKSSPGVYNIRKAGSHILIFSRGCSLCEEQRSAAMSFVRSGKKRSVLMIDFDLLLESYPDEAEKLLQTFDLSYTPFAVSKNRKGEVLEKYFIF